MSLKFISGNIFDSHAEALINPVNCKGVMGAGLAEQFKKLYPAMFLEYRKVCQMNKLQPGTLHLYSTNKLIVNFPTKINWFQPSKLEWINEGLTRLAIVLVERQIKSVAIPALGCGYGQLSWRVVKDAIAKWYDGNPEIENIDIVVYEPN